MYVGVRAKLEARRTGPGGRREKATCPVCSVRITVLTNGALAPHLRDTSVGRIHCPGSGLVVLQPSAAPRPVAGGGGQRPPGAQRRRLRALQVAANVEDDVYAIFRRQAEVLGTNATTLVRRLGRVNVERLMGELDWDSDWQAPLRATLARVVREELVRGGTAESQRLGLRAVFDGDNPFALQFTREHVPNLVRETTLETQMAIGDVVRRGLLEQRTPHWMASEIRQVVGLTSRQAESVLRIRRALEGQGASAEQIEKAASRQQARLLRYRSALIARTETIRANAAGTQAAWMQGRAEGALPEGARRRWIAGPGERTCEVCRGLEEAGPVGILEAFRSPAGGSVFLPPAHPACRCTVSLVLSP